MSILFVMGAQLLNCCPRLPKGLVQVLVQGFHKGHLNQLTRENIPLDVFEHHGFVSLQAGILENIQGLLDDTDRAAKPYLVQFGCVVMRFLGYDGRLVCGKGAHAACQSGEGRNYDLDSLCGLGVGVRKVAGHSGYRDTSENAKTQICLPSGKIAHRFAPQISLGGY